MVPSASMLSSLIGPMQADFVASGVEEKLGAVGGKNNCETNLGVSEREPHNSTVFPRKRKWRRPGNPPWVDYEWLWKLGAIFAAGRVAYVGGPCGCGKSTLVPGLLVTLLGIAKGVVHCVPTRTTGATLFAFHSKRDSYAHQRANTWYGKTKYSKMAPLVDDFVCLCTPAALFHRFQHARRWDDIGFLVLDEVQGHGRNTC